VVYVRTTTIRVPAETRDRLNALAKRRGAPAGEIVAELVREADERALLADAEQGWSQLAADRALLAAYRAEAGELEAFEASTPAY
jgi:predicted DNA-binding protein